MLCSCVHWKEWYLGAGLLGDLLALALLRGLLGASLLDDLLALGSGFLKSKNEHQREHQKMLASQTRTPTMK